jgi:PHAX RNA-binding domain
MDPITVDQLAAALQETNMELLKRVLVVLGPDHAAQILKETLEVEAHGGMLVHTGVRRRTPGGVFFLLVRRQATSSQRDWLFPRSTRQHRPQPAQAQVLTWDKLPGIVQTLATQPVGEARSMKLTLIGRPGKVEVRQTCVVFQMQGKPPSSLPRGLPPVPTTPPIIWTVMVALRQWNRVKDSLATHQEDALIIEGYGLLQGTQHVLMAQSCISMLQQRAQKQAQREQTETTL